LNAVIDATLHLPEIPGGKKLIYNHIDMPLTPISDFAEKGKSDPFFAELNRLCSEHKGLWNLEAEKYLLSTIS
jgi:L-sorbose 1-phosphate reductase